jgi:hypothetical protein
MLVEFDGQLTGPTDIEVGPDPGSDAPTWNNDSALILSDEGSIYAFQRAASGARALKRIVHLPARRWSGLAFDGAGRLYFADYEGGDVFAMRWPDLRALLAADEPISSESALEARAVRIARGLKRPGDVEVLVTTAHPGGLLVVATAKGLLPLPMPVVASLPEGITEVRIKRFHKEEPVLIDAIRRLATIVPSFEDLEDLRLTLRVKQADAAGRDVWREFRVGLDLNGVTIVDRLE